jgi:hypothetical protein
MQEMILVNGVGWNEKFPVNIGVNPQMLERSKGFLTQMTRKRPFP